MFNLLKKIYWIIFRTHQWFILYKTKENQDWIRLLQPKNVSRADSFIVYENNKYYIFFEEFDIQKRHGYLCVGELNQDTNNLDNIQICLEKPYHLSFPNVFKSQDTYYMIPESHANNTIDLYEFYKFPYKLKKVKTLINNINAADSVILFRENLWYLFTNIETHKDSLHSEHLSIFTSNDLLGDDFKPSPQNPVEVNPSIARMGGQFFEQNQKLFRVSQDCKVRYGYKVNIMEVDDISQNSYKEHFSESLYPPKGYIAFHTLNSSNDIVVADGKIIIKTPNVVLMNIFKLFKLMINKLRRELKC